MSAFELSKFIWMEKPCAPDTYGEFYVPFEYNGNGATMNISCDSDYTVFINGKFAFCNQYGDFEHFKVYDTLDLSSHLVKGKNSIAILVWYFGLDTQKYKKYDAGLIFEIKDMDGKILSFSDETVLSRKSKAYKNGRRQIITTQLGYGFSYNAQIEDDWKIGKLIDFNKSLIVDKKCAFFERPNKKLINSEKNSAKLVKVEGNTYVYDLGKEVFGLFYLDCESDDAQMLTISFGEDLVNGKVDRFIAERDFSFEYHTKSGKNTYENYMLRVGCRYLQVDAITPLRINEIGLINQYYPVVEREIYSEDKDILRIYNLCVNTLNLSMSEHYMDCPWREQALYTFDSRNQMLAGYSVYRDGNFEYVKSNLKLISKDYWNDGLLSICYPCGTALRIPSFSLYYVIQVKEYLENSKDSEFIIEILPKLKKILDAFKSKIENGLVVNFCGEDYWNFYDWSPLLQGTSERSKKPLPDLIINCLYVMALNCFEFICDYIDQPFDYGKVREIVRDNIKKTYYNAEEGLFFFGDDKTEFTEVGNSLAILSGICTMEEKETICRAIASGKLLSGTLSLKTFKYDALLSVGDKYKDYIIDEIKREYLYMLSQGADCTWETIEGKKAFGNAGSLCHGWSAIPAYYLIKFGLIKEKEN